MPELKDRLRKVRTGKNTKGGFKNHREKHDVKNALLAFQCALADKEKILGPNHQEVIEIHKKIGDILIQLGRREEAKYHSDAYYEYKLRIFERNLVTKRFILGPKHKEVSGAHKKIGQVLTKLGREEEAKYHFETSQIYDNNKERLRNQGRQNQIFNKDLKALPEFDCVALECIPKNDVKQINNGLSESYLSLFENKRVWI